MALPPGHAQITGMRRTSSGEDRASDVSSPNVGELASQTEQLQVASSEPGTPVPGPGGVSGGGPDNQPTVSGSTQLLEDPRLNEAMLSDSGPTALLARLKQSIISAKEFATFVRKKSQLESEHQAAVKKLVRHSCESIRKPEGRQGTFVRQFESMIKMNDRQADVANTYVAALHVMHDELSELAKSVEKSRKNIKESCLRNEKNVSEAEQMAEKAKAKYDSLAEDFERMRTGDPKSKFGFKQSKTPQHEEELHRKVSSAESEYKQRVDQAQKLRNELIHKLRPVSVKELKELTLECDSGISLQLQKYANLSEVLVLNSGFIVSPLKPSGSTIGPPSMRELAAQVDNERDFYDSIVSKSSRAAASTSNKSQVQFRQHPALASAYPSSSVSSNPTPSPAPAPPRKSSDFASPQLQQQFSPVSERQMSPPPQQSQPPPPQASGSAPMLDPIRSSQINLAPVDSQQSFSTEATKEQPRQYPPGTTSHMPSYGTPLEELLDYEEGTVPRVVYQCIRAIDSFGLEVEGIYRTNGNQTQVQEIKKMFDADSASVDLLHPSANVNDIHAVASALKQYFHELPDPLLTAEYHDDFVKAAQIDNDVQRRDAIHATINNLPDPNYTTLRYLVFHLYRIQEREAINRMSIVNLGIVWGPALSAVDYNNVGEMALLGRIVETILFNAYVIFDAE